MGRGYVAGVWGEDDVESGSSPGAFSEVPAVGCGGAWFLFNKLLDQGVLDPKNRVSDGNLRVAFDEDVCH
jgi:hypothetical protein